MPNGSAFPRLRSHGQLLISPSPARFTGSAAGFEPRDREQPAVAAAGHLAARDRWACGP